MSERVFKAGAFRSIPTTSKGWGNDSDWVIETKEHRLKLISFSASYTPKFTIVKMRDEQNRYIAVQWEQRGVVNETKETFVFSKYFPVNCGGTVYFDNDNVPNVISFQAQAPLISDPNETYG